MLKTLLTTALGLTAAATLTVEAEGCSRIPQRPTAWPASTHIEEMLARQNEPLFARHVRNALHIDIAIAREQTEIGTTQVLSYSYETYSVRFEILENLKGSRSGTFDVTGAGGYPIVRGYESDWTANRIPSYREDLSTLEHRGLLSYETASSCGETSGVSFNSDWTYLVVQNGSGEIEAAIPLATRPLTREEVQQGDFRGHLWIQTTLQALDNPLADRLYHASIPEFFQAHGGGELVEVTDCQRPVVTFIEYIGEPSLSSFSNNFDGQPISLEEFLTEYAHISTLHGAPPLGAVDFAVIDERRYDLVPFDAETCRVGQRYIRFDFYQYFPIDENDVVDLTNVVSQVNLSGRGLYPLAEYRRWQEVEPVEPIENEPPQ